MTFHLITIFPEIFDSYLNESILKRAQDEKKIKIKVHNLRDFATDKHKTVDDTPYGGGPGMVLKVGPIFRCIESIKKELDKKNNKGAKFQISNFKFQKKSQNSKHQNPSLKIILTSAKGKEYTQKKAEDLKNYSDIIIICGRYEGVDERVAQYIADEEISIGKYVLTGGELPAMVIVDSVTRLLKGVLGNEESLVSETHSKFQISNFKSQAIRDYPVYTKPAEFQGWEVPEVLQSGNHGEIDKWRKENQ